MSSLDDAVRLLEQGEWEAAHKIVQDDPSQLAAWAHGIVHMLEGDMSNAGYWYRRAQRPLPDPSAAGAEIAALKERTNTGDD